MGAAVSSVEGFCNLLGRSRLLKPPEVRAVYQSWRQKGTNKFPGETERFAKWLVFQHYLTDYQAQQLVVGNVDQFFLNHYKLLDLIGRGRMAGIYKAVHSLGHVVAVKAMPASKSQDRMLLGRFKREARMAVRFKHPNIVRTFHLGQAAGRHYIVMEFLEGETFEDLLRRRRKLPFVEAVRLSHQALAGLQHIHEKSTIHRDLKPGNLMVVPPRPPGAPDNTLFQTVKILDIGLGRVLFDEEMTLEKESLLLTTDGMMLGTVEYMAPEQARDAHKADIRSDVYSLGCVLYELLTGQPPFDDKNVVQLILNHAMRQPRPVRELEPSVPAGLQAVVDRMLAKDPARRYQTPYDALLALQPFLAGLPSATAETSSLAQSYLKWVESQGIEEVDAAPMAGERWFYKHAGQIFGPAPTSQLRQLAAAAMLLPDDLLWMEGDDPGLAIPAKAAIDFALYKDAKAHTQKAPHRPTAAPPPRAAGPPPLQNAAVVEMGYDPATGQIFDPEKFRKWQREQKVKRDQELASMPTALEAFLKAQMNLDHWVDLERNRRPILAGDTEFLRRDPDIQRFMSFHQRYGEVMVHKLWHYLEFMIENRRKYYSAFA